MDLGQLASSIAGDDVVVELPGYGVTYKDLIIFVLAIFKLVLLVVVFVLYKTKINKKGQLHMKWV